MSARDAWREVCMAQYRITGDMMKATAFADSVEKRIRAEVLREAAEKIRNYDWPVCCACPGESDPYDAADLIDPEVSDAL